MSEGTLPMMVWGYVEGRGPSAESVYSHESLSPARFVFPDHPDVLEHSLVALLEHTLAFIDEVWPKPPPGPIIYVPARAPATGYFYGRSPERYAANYLSLQAALGREPTMREIGDFLGVTRQAALKGLSGARRLGLIPPTKSNVLPFVRKATG